MTVEEFVNFAIGKPWVDRGRDYGNWDCWGLICQFYDKCLNISLPTASDHTCKTPIAAHRQMNLSASVEGVEVKKGMEKQGDILFFSPCHAGLVVVKGYMLHCKEDVGTVSERYYVKFWSDRLTGIYRHVRLS